MDSSCSPSSSNRPDPRERSELSRKINDHIYELYAPKEGPKAVELEIVFFHGLQFGKLPYEKAYLTTWTNDDNVLWPKAWLPDKFPQARILSVSYDASMKQTAETGRLDLYNIGENLTHDVGDAEVGQSPGSPVILVGHCFGGLVIKQLCVQAAKSLNFHADEKMGKFLDNLKGVFFYGTPHQGTDFPKFLSKLLGGPLLEYVLSLNEQAARLDGDFLTVCRNRDLPPVRMASVGEKNKTKILGHFYAVIVPEASARYQNYPFYTVDADHLSICKPMSKTSNGFKRLSTFIQEIEPEKLVITDPENFQMLTAKKSIGLDGKVDDVRERLEKAKILGIVGMGGIGKTTLAMAAFNKLCHFFDFTCFVPDVKLISGGQEVVKQQISQLMCFKGKYISGMKRRIDWKGKRLLLVLDDIDDDAAEILASMVYQAGPDSWFMVTCQDRDLLKEIEDISTYEMSFLTYLHAKDLFMGYAFAQQATVPQHLNAFVEKIVQKCDGLPLTLEIFGKCLMGNEEIDFWRETYDALEEADRLPIKRYDEKLWSKLRLSFSNLGYKEQQMFLDATTFFSNSKGMDFREKEQPGREMDGGRQPREVDDGQQPRELDDGQQPRDRDDVFDYFVTRDVVDSDDDDLDKWRLPKLDNGWCWRLSEAKAAWGVAYGKAEIRWKALVNASLVYDVKDSEPIRVHEQLKSLGRKIVADDKCKRVWNACEGRKLLFSDALSNCQGIHSLRITFSAVEFSSAREYDDSFCNLKAVKYLESDYGHPAHVGGLRIGASNSSQMFPANLIVLCSPQLSFGQAPIDFADLENPHMAVLILTDYCESFLPESLVRLSFLKIFKLVAAEKLEELPPFFGKLRALQALVIRCCPALSTLSASFGNLRALKRLRIENCAVLGSLPEDFGSLLALEKLKISGCPVLATLPASFGNLRALKRLTIQGCAIFDGLSDDFGNLPALEKLFIADCPVFTTLPARFGNLCALKVLAVHFCDAFSGLSDDFGNLPALEKLLILGCPVLATLSDDFGNLPALEKLFIGDCAVFATLPASFGNLCALKVMAIYFCDAFRDLSHDFGNLPALEKLDIFSCQIFTTLPASFGNLCALKALVIGQCDVFSGLSDDFGNLHALEELRISECPIFTTLPASFGNLCALKFLLIRECDVFSGLPHDFGNLSALEDLLITGCPVFTTLPASFGNLCALKSLVIRACDVFSGLSDNFENISALELLVIWDCPVLSILPATFGNLCALKELAIAGCDVLSGLPDDFGNLSTLEELYIWRCPVLATLPASFGNLRALKVLVLRDCDVFSGLSDDFGNLPALEKLLIVGCPVLATLPASFRNLRALKELTIY